MNKRLLDKMPATPDLNRERLEQLKALMPDLFTNDGTLDPDELKRLVDPDSVAESERFEFRWFGKANAKRNAFTPTLASLEVDLERSVNPDLANGNAIIEGENLEVLKCLLKSYRNQVKCIYIDPPYNTGNDFVYSDTWDEDRESYWEHVGVTENGVKVDTNTKTDGRFHSNWLNLIFPRLLLARALLAENGAIFISVDDNEVHNLRKICDEVFGQDNRVEAFVWKKSYGGGAKERFAVTQHEYILMYARSIECLSDLWLPADPESIERYYKFEDDRGRYRIKPLEATKSMDPRPNLVYPILAPNGTEVWPKRQWWWKKERVTEAIQNNGLVFTETSEGISVSYKQYLTDDDGQERGRKPFSILDGPYTQVATAEIRSLFDDQVVFQFPKPSELIKTFIASTTSNDDIVLDFFAGSGATGQAVMKVNAEDYGTRKYILVQIPESINEGDEAYKAGFRRISDITIERNKRVVKRFDQEAGKKAEETEGSLPGMENDDTPAYRTGFKVYRLAKSRFPRVEFQPDPEKTEEENLAALDTYIRDKEAAFLMTFDREEILQEVLLKNGFKLDVQTEPLADFKENTVFRARDSVKEATICLDYDLKEETVAKLKGMEGIFICLEQALDTTKKWNLRAEFGERLVAF